MHRESLHLSAELQRALERAGERFLAEFYQVEISRHPDNVDALAELGELLTRSGEYERGLEVDRQLVRLVPGNPTVHYNLACSLARLERREEALDALEEAARLGYVDHEFMLADADLESLRGEQRFRSLVERLASTEA